MGGLFPPEKCILNFNAAEKIRENKLIPVLADRAFCSLVRIHFKAQNEHRFEL
jgi:hypothetical protein